MAENRIWLSILPAGRINSTSRIEHHRADVIHKSMLHTLFHGTSIVSRYSIDGINNHVTHQAHKMQSLGHPE